MKRLFLIGLFVLSVCNIHSQTETDLLIDACGKFESREYSDAIAAFDRLIGTYKPTDERVMLYRGIAKFNIGDYKGARNDFEDLNRRNYNEANLWTARVYVAQHNHAEAIRFISKYLKNETMANPDLVKKDTLLRPLYNEGSWFDLWQNEWETDQQKLINEAMYYCNNSDYNKARQTLERGYSVKDSPGYLHYVSSLVYFNEGITELALNDINIALSKEPNNNEYLKQKAECLVRLNNKREAINIYTQLLEDFAGDFNVRLNRAKAAFSAQEYEMATVDIELYLKYIQSEEAKILSGDIYYSSGQYLSALKVFNNLMDEKQPDAKLYRARGNTYLKTTMYSQAAYDLSMSLDLEPDNAEANFNLGLAEYYRGNLRLACYYWSRAEKFGSLQAKEFTTKYCK